MGTDRKPSIYAHPVFQTFLLFTLLFPSPRACWNSFVPPASNRSCLLSNSFWSKTNFVLSTFCAFACNHAKEVDVAHFQIRIKLFYSTHRICSMSFSNLDKTKLSKSLEKVVAIGLFWFYFMPFSYTGVWQQISNTSVFMSFLEALKIAFYYSKALFLRISHIHTSVLTKKRAE